MDNNMNTNEDDKYTNYTYQGSDNQYYGNAPQYQGQSEPNTYSEPNSYQAPDSCRNANYSQNTNGYQNNGYNQGQANDYNYNNGYNQNQANGYNYNNNGYSQNQANGYNYNNGYSQNQTSYNYTGVYETVPAGGGTSGTAIGSMVCGILSIVLACGWGIGIILAIIALVLSGKFKKSNNGNPCGQSTAGLICGIVGLILSILVLAYYILIVVLAVEGFVGSSLSSTTYYNW